MPRSWFFWACLLLPPSGAIPHFFSLLSWARSAGLGLVAGMLARRLLLRMAVAACSPAASGGGGGGTIGMAGGAARLARAGALGSGSSAMVDAGSVVTIISGVVVVSVGSCSGVSYRVLLAGGGGTMQVPQSHCIAGGA
jgi:hypothetical protein